MYGLRHKRLTGKRAHTDMSRSCQGTNADAANSQRVDDGCQQTNADAINSQRVVDGCQETNADGSHSQSLADASNNNTIVTTIPAREDCPSKPRGRGKRNVTKLRLPPHAGKVGLKPVGTRQFTYVNYNPKGYKYGSQVGVLIKRLYPGMVDIRDEKGNIIQRRAALSWHDYYCKKQDKTGTTIARLVKAEFWNLFTVTQGDARKADRNLETYLVKRVSHMMYQTRLDAVKKHEDCDDNQARNILLTKEQYLNCRPSWCSKEAWAFLSMYWDSEEFKNKRRTAQEARQSSRDVAQNRGGSRPWGETQQLLEYKFGANKVGTLNTYAVMKSGFKNVDSTGRSAPILSEKAQRRLNNYNARAQLDENSKELDVQALYFMEGGLRHGRVPIGDGAVDKKQVKAIAKSSHHQSTTNASYQAMVEENDQLKETNDELRQTNKQVSETNGILVEEISVYREMLMGLYSDLNKEPDAALINRLSILDVCRHQVTSSSHVGNNPSDMHNNGNDMDSDDDDDDYDEMDDDDVSSNNTSEYIDDDASADNGGSEEVNMDELLINVS